MSRVKLTRVDELAQVAKPSRGRPARKKVLKTLDIALEEVTMGPRVRPVDPDWVKALAVLIRDDGLKCPIEVFRAEGDAHWTLVAGAHRLDAVRRLGENTIEARVLDAKDVAGVFDLRLAEVSDNLFRKELDCLARSASLFALKQAYEAKFPALRHGGDRKSRKIKSPSWRLDETQGDRGSQPLHPSEETNEAPFTINEADLWPRIAQEREIGKSSAVLADFQQQRFTADIAEKIGLSERAIQRAVLIWTRLAPSVRERLMGTEHADNQQALLALCDLTQIEQDKALDLLFSTPPKARRLMEAVREILGTTKLAAKDRVLRFESNWCRLNRAERRAFIHNNVEEVLEALNPGDNVFTSFLKRHRREVLDWADAQRRGCS